MSLSNVALPPLSVVAVAITAAQFSPCRSKRGAVVFRGREALTHGHNHKPSGFDCDGSDACKATCRLEAVHAEQAALIGWRGVDTRGADLLHVKTVNQEVVPSGGPSCAQCSKLAIEAGIVGFWLFGEHGWYRYDITELHRLSVEAERSGTVAVV